MALSPEQREARRLAKSHPELVRIGSSDAPGILGVDQKRSRLAIYLTKVHDLEEEEENEPMRLGNRFERAILEEAAERLGVEIERDVTAQGPEPYLAANLDAIVTRTAEMAKRGEFYGSRVESADGCFALGRVLPPAALEAKFTGLGHLFGEPGTDVLPDKVLVQTAFQMGCLPSAELVHVPVLLARYGRPRVEIFVAPRSANLVEVVLEECRRFWLEHVLPRVPPDPSPGLGEAALGVLKRVRREPHTVAEVDAKLAVAYQRRQRWEKRAKDAKERAQAALLTAMGDAEGGDFGDAKKLYSYLEQTRPGFDLEAFRIAHPKLAAKFATESRNRTLRLVNKRIGGKV